jgi:hypothetical protein
MTKFRTYRAAIILAALDLLLFVLANLPALRNATHGAKHVIGGAFWMGFLAGTLALLVTLTITITRATRRRRALP